MKHLVTLICILSSSITFAFSQKATITFSTDLEINVSVYKPIDGAFNPYYAQDELQLKPNMSINYSIEVNDFSLTLLQYSNGRRIFTILLPGDNLECIFKNNQILFKGSNAEGQFYLNNNMSFSDYAQNIDSIVSHNISDKIDYKGLDNDFKNIYFEKPYEEIERIQKAGGISKSFEILISKEIKLLYISSKELFYKALLRGQVKNYKPTSSDIIEINKRAISMHEDTSVMNTTTMKFHNYFNGTYLIFKWNSLDSLTRSRLREGHNSKALGNNRIFLTQPIFMQPILIGRFFLTELNGNNNTFNHDTVLAIMKEKFPRSEYIPIISKLIEEEKIRKVAPKEVIATIIDGSNINSLKELTQTNMLKGKKIFIDLWETNCSPCKIEFKFNENLHKLLNKYENVVKLYVSLDQENADSTWRDMIGFYKLNGFNIRANKSLSKDIKEKIYEGGSMLVPRFVLLDSESTILGNYLPKPSSGKLLEDALDKILTK